MKDTNEHIIGSEVTDKTTGLRGIVRGRAVLAHGAVELLVQPKGCQTDGTPLKQTWMHEFYLEEVDA